MDKKTDWVFISQIIGQDQSQLIIEIDCGFFLAIPKDKMKGCFIVRQNSSKSFVDSFFDYHYKIVRYSNTAELVEGLVNYLAPS